MRFLALIISVLPCFLFAQSTTNTTDTTKPSAKAELYNFGTGNEFALKEGWKRFENSDISKVDCPKDWEVVENFMETVFLIKEATANKEDVFAENVNLVRTTAQSSKSDDADFSLNNFVEETLVDHRNYFEEFELLEQKDGRYQKIKAVILILKGKANDIHFKIKQCFFILNDYIYTFTFTSQKDSFDDYISTANDIYKSLIIK